MVFGVLPSLLVYARKKGVGAPDGRAAQMHGEARGSVVAGFFLRTPCMLEKGSLFLRARLAFHGPAENEPSLWVRGGWWVNARGGYTSLCHR